MVYVYVDLVGMFGFQFDLGMGVCMEVFQYVVMVDCYFVGVDYCYFLLLYVMLFDWCIDGVVGGDYVDYDCFVDVVD